MRVCGGGIGTGLVLAHNGLGGVISQEATIGNDCTINQHVTIGAGKNGYPIIGDNCVIGENSFVNRDVESNTTVAGVPAHIIRK